MILGVDLPITGVPVPALGLIALGLAVGFISGFFGIGGGIIAVPMLKFFFNVPFHIAIGSSLALIIGTSISASYRHHQLGNIDYRMGLVLMAGTFLGIEGGAGTLELFKSVGCVSIRGREMPFSDLVISIIYIVLLYFVGVLIFRESRASKREARDVRDSMAMRSLFGRYFRSIRLRPMIRFESADREISIWMLLLLCITVGFIVGLLGVGGGFILVPAMIYLLGVRTKIAIGTSLFSIIFGAMYGTFTHTVKGNVDIVLVLMLLIGSTVGAQFGATATRRFKGPQIRFYFSLLTFIAALMSTVKLASDIFF